ncbi:MAG: DNA metabolism protein [Akkermansiaceae bacterium]|nr:DNA metabolism protein [Akkermansiaceae bacterium]
MITAIVDHTVHSWRLKARELLRRGIPPEKIDWCAENGEKSLLPAEEMSSVSPSREIKVPADFLPLATSVCAHTDPRRWAILYRLLYRLTHGGEKHLLKMPSDPDTRQCQMWAKAVGRDIHKMHAFVRFRLIHVDESTGKEEFIAWFEPTYRIVRLGTPFFVKRFANMDWSILTPDECAHWNGKHLTFLPGANRHQVPDSDAHDDLWRTYYRSIFNPARLKVKAMQSEIPQKYWKNLPEASIISELIAGSKNRVDEMLETPERPVKPMPNNAYLRSLHTKEKSPETP